MQVKGLRQAKAAAPAEEGEGSEGRQGRREEASRGQDGGVQLRAKRKDKGEKKPGAEEAAEKLEGLKTDDDARGSRQGGSEGLR